MSRLTTGTPTAADLLRAVADHTETHQLNHIGNISPDPEYGVADVLLYVREGSAIDALLPWARSLNATDAIATMGPNDYHLHVTGTLPNGTLIEVKAITNRAETTAMAPANINGRITLTHLATFTCDGQ